MASSGGFDIGSLLNSVFSNGSGASLLNSILNTGGNLYGSLLQKQLVDQLLGGKVNVLNNLNGLQGNAQSNIGQQQPGLLNTAQGGATAGSNNFFNSQQGGQYYVNQGLSGTDQFKQMLDPSTIPGLNNYFNYNGGIMQAAGQGAGQASQLGSGQGAGQQPLQAAGTSLLGGNTQNNAFQTLLQQLASGTLQQGGYTPQLNEVSQYGTQLLQPNQLASQAGGLASSIFGNGQPLLPMGEVQSMAVNQSATQSQQQSDALQRQLMNRTGTTGPSVVAGGQENSLLNELGNQALQNQSSALTNATLGQQGLQLQQSGLGNQLLNSVTGANLGYSGQGLNALLQGASQATQNQNVLGQLGLGGGNLGLATAQTGGSLLNSLNSSQTSGLGALASLLGVSDTTNQNLSNTLMGSQNLGLNQNTQMYQALASMLGQNTNMAGQSLQAMLGNEGVSSNILQDYINQLTNAGTSQVGLYSGTPSYPSNFMQNILAGSGGALNPSKGGINGGGGGSPSGGGGQTPGSGGPLGTGNQGSQNPPIWQGPIDTSGPGGTSSSTVSYPSGPLIGFDPNGNPIYGTGDPNYNPIPDLSAGVPGLGSGDGYGPGTGLFPTIGGGDTYGGGSSGGGGNYYGAPDSGDVNSWGP